ncbi:MAG: bifunctional folylpolyglutamate synthase/dihydrofolate synthase [Acidobacteriota bacterium]|nr:bifunctional folylpolyglutamate synthase/dihydrofolate synthase [Acidobacteriota bacterium]
MSYFQAIQQLNAMTPELHTQPGQPRRKFSLEEIGTLLEALGNPHHQFRSVLIAGTNGKGSTASTLASILNASGLRSGLYTSPHLVRPNERIRVRGIDIRDDDFARHFHRVVETGNQLVAEQKLPQLPSFFEVLTAMAFLHFAEESVDLAVLEVGMGGRLDATNIVSPLLSIVTDISLDHTEWLGPTISAIAREKAGIMRPNGTLITLPQHPEANQVLGEVAVELNVRGVSAVPYMPQMSAAHGSDQGAYTIEALGSTVRVNSPLHGAHQHRNVALAVAAAVELAEQHAFSITTAAIEEGIYATRWPARLETLLSGNTQWILDVAHNPAGAWALRSALRTGFDIGEPGNAPATLVFSCLKDKPVDELAHILFPLFERVIFAPIASPRATLDADLLAAAESVGVSAIVASSMTQALALAAEPARIEEPNTPRKVVVAGSVYLVGQARALLLAPVPELKA